MEKRWHINSLSDDELEIARRLAEELSVCESIAILLVQRGIHNHAAAKKFFRPKMTDLHDPFLMTDMDKAVERIKRAQDNGETILVYGDYDVDGTTSVALCYSFLRKYFEANRLDYYIPERNAEGYGISFQGIDYAKEHGHTLIVALDCGIKATEKVKYAKELGIDFIICDHHNPGDELPCAYALLDPKRPDCSYPYKELSGCGIGFKLAQAYLQHMGGDEEEIYKYLDFVAVSIASDIVPLDGENRVLCYYGIEQLSSNPSCGLKAIIKHCRLDKESISVSDIVFKIGPRINASGRIASGKSSVDFLLSKDDQTAELLAQKIDEVNIKRKEFDREMTADAIDDIANDPTSSNKKSTVLFNPNWHKGVIGIVASRLIEHCYRPTVILTESNGKATGSARSVSGFNIYHAIESCKQYLDSFGGHKYAAGLTLDISKVEAFSEAFEAYVEQNITEEQKKPVIDIDMELRFDQITSKFFRILKQFSPYGPKAMKPVFFTQRVYNDNGGSRLVGADKQHIKLKLIDPESRIQFQGIAFNQSDKFPYIESGKPIDICYKIQENEFPVGVKRVQLFVTEIRESKPQS